MRMMMMAPNPTPKTTITPPRSPPSSPPPPPPTMVGSESMAPQDRDQRQAPPPGPLKCPRCDSSNTKFCYYNNYSLSQPRHFCKACKRYWTRGGTLRDVPVGGGCRKNKSVGKKHRRHAQAAETSSASAATKNPNPNPPHHGVSTYPSSDQLTSLFYGANFLTAAACDVLGGQSVIPSNYQPSSGFIDASMHQSAVNFWSNNDEFSSFGSQDAAAISLMPKVNGYQPLLPYDLRQADCANSNLGLLMKDVKAEGIDNSASTVNYSNMDAWQADYPFDQALDVANDSSYMYWNPMGGACWPDAANSSVSPLI